jgi:hypothetical protein
VGQVKVSPLMVNGAPGVRSTAANASAEKLSLILSMPPSNPLGV